ncbi:XRE family transcriptional regulator [Natronospirillum operosum]|uniref:XRE family transcriptional regulator n=1 Tax=Natronospirillum operosum TaxID=2759953 RepID=A0A4Z0W5Y5_9GAMM|nr:helix-turn-helix transcriptional regulator [Natronospirillum operosum]TGG92500.1 XRE family transcriptional regulator [Natronospirillum operosum]
MDELIGSRLKSVRKALDYTQKSMAEAVGSKFRSWQQYEGGSRVPGSQVIAGLVEQGINANWVLTGHGPMYLKDLGSAGFDETLMRVVIEAIEEAMEMLDLEITPASKKADLILAIYEMYNETGAQPDAKKVIRLIKTAA